MTDRLDAMAAFVAVADAEGFAPAARRLGLSPSAVTRLVAGLEDRLGLRLLQRTTRRVALTDAGARFLMRARRILADLREAEDSAAAERATPSGHLVVAAPVTFGRLHAGPLVCEFLNRHPEVTGELIPGARRFHLRAPQTPGGPHPRPLASSDNRRAAVAASALRAENRNFVRLVLEEQCW